MLPTLPRSSVRSMCSSWTAPFSTTATRVSWGAQLIRMSCIVRSSAVPVSGPDVDARPLEQRGRLVQRQAHDTGVAALDLLDPGGCAALDRVGAGLSERLAGRDVALDPRRRDDREANPRHARRQARATTRRDCDAADDAVAAAREQREHSRRIGAMERL